MARVTVEDCLEKVIGKDMVREKLILLYRKTERYADASRELLSLAESALREAQWPLAVERFKQVLSMQPENLDVLEPYVDVEVTAPAAKGEIIDLMAALKASLGMSEAEAQKPAKAKEAKAETKSGKAKKTSRKRKKAAEG